MRARIEKYGRRLMTAILRTCTTKTEGVPLDRRIPELLSVKIYDREAGTVFHFTLAKFVQKWPPFVVFCQIFGRVFGQKNVAGVATIHDALRGIDTSACQIGAARNIDDSANRPAMDAHAQAQAGVIFERAA